MYMYQLLERLNATYGTGRPLGERNELAELGKTKSLTCLQLEKCGNVENERKEWVINTSLLLPARHEDMPKQQEHVSNNRKEKEEELCSRIFRVESSG